MDKVILYTDYTSKMFEKNYQKKYLIIILSKISLSISLERHIYIIINTMLHISKNKKKNVYIFPSKTMMTSYLSLIIFYCTILLNNKKNMLMIEYVLVDTQGFNIIF